MLLKTHLCKGSHVLYKKRERGERYKLPLDIQQLRKRNKRKKGFAILIERQLIDQEEQCKYVFKIIIGIRLNLGEEQVNIVEVYASENNPEEIIREEFLS